MAAADFPIVQNPSTQVLDVGTVALEEQGGKRRKIVLSGRALPYGPIQVPVKQRIDKRSYAGNPVATIQVIGPAEQQTKLTGAWKDRFLGEFDNGTAPATVNGEAVTTAADLMDLVENVCISGQLLLVAFDHVRRYGMLTEVDPKWVTAHDVDYEFTFEWNARDAAQPSPATTVDLSDATQGFADQLAGLSDATPSTSPFALGDQIRRGISSIESRVGQLQETVSERLLGALDAASAVRSAMSAMGNIQATCRDQIATLESARTGAAGLASNVSGTGAAMATHVYFRDQIDRLRDMIRDAAARSALLAQSPDLVRFYTGTGGEDLRDVSTLFFGTPNRWAEIARLNGLVSSAVEPGQVLVIPSDNAQEAA